MATKKATLTSTTFALIPSELAPTKTFGTVCYGQGMNTYMLVVDTDGSLKWSRYGTNTSIDLTEGHFGNVHCMWTI